MAILCGHFFLFFYKNYSLFLFRKKIKMNFFIFWILFLAHLHQIGFAIQLEWTNEELKADGETKSIPGNVPRIVANITIKRRRPSYSPILPPPIINCGCCYCIQPVCPCQCPPECHHTTSHPSNSSHSSHSMPRHLTTSPLPPHSSTFLTTKKLPPSTSHPPIPPPYTPYPQQLRCCLILNLICSLCSCFEKCGFPFPGNSYMNGPPLLNHSALLSNEGQMNPILQKLLGTNTLFLPNTLPNDVDTFSVANKEILNKQQIPPTSLDLNAAGNLIDKTTNSMTNQTKTNFEIDDNGVNNSIASAAVITLKLFNGMIVGIMLPALVSLFFTALF